MSKNCHNISLINFQPHCICEPQYSQYLHLAEHAEQAEQTEQLNIVSYLVMLLWRQLFSATIGLHMRP